MAASAFRQALEDAIKQRHSAVHPFSEAWVTGKLSRPLLGEWELSQPGLAARAAGVTS